MKKAFYRIGFIGLTLLIALVFIGCPGRESPSTVVSQLHAAIDRGDTARMTELMTTETAGLALKMLEILQEMYDESGGITSMEETITGDTAVVIVTYRNGGTETYDLVRVDGRWRVAAEIK